MESLNEVIVQSKRPELQVFVDNPGLLNFVPLLYIAWADDILTPTEIQTIRGIIEEQKWLQSEEKELLHQWLNPQDPPTIAELKSWLHLLEVTSDQIPEEAKKSLVDVGLQISKIGSEDSYVRCSTPEACKALYEIEGALGIVSEETYRELFNPTTDDTQSDAGNNFDPDKLTDVLNEEYAAIIQKMNTLLSDPAFSYVATHPKEEYREKILTWCKQLAKQGIGSLAYPKEYGGQDDIGTYFMAMECLGYHDLSLLVKFGVQFGLWGMSIYLLGTKKHHEQYLERIGTLELPGAFAMTETGHGSNVRSIETTATYDKNSEEFIIHTPNEQARKDYIGNAAKHGLMATVFAQLIVNEEQYGVCAVIVPLRDEDSQVLPGIRIEDCGEKMGLNGVDNGRIWFDNVRVPRENLLDRYSQVSKDGEYSSPINSDSKRFFTMLAALVGGRIGIPRAGLSATKSALTIAVRYAAKRRQFGASDKPETPIIDYQTHQKRLFPAVAKTYALHFALRYLTRRYIDRKEEESKEIEALAAGLKAYTTWFATSTIQTCREACGGQGYLASNRFTALKADTDIFTTFEGDNTVLMQLVAKGLLSEFKQQFHDINFFGLVKYLAGRAGTAISELNPIVVRKTDEDHLLDQEFHLSAFKYREDDLTISCAQRLKKYIDAGQNSYDAAVRCQNHMVSMAEAFIERIVLEQFIAAVDATSEGPEKDQLTVLYQLFALSTIDAHKGWYLEQGYLEGVKSKAIRKVVRKLCYKMKNDMVGLVDAFAIPNSCIGAPIGLDR